jgi:uncharacterized membrane protein YbhN (UPF0104 family)
VRRSDRLLLVGAAMLGVGAVALLTHRTAVHAVWHALRLVPLTAVLAAAVLVLLQVILQACRLWAVLPRDVTIPIRRVAYAFTLGEWANMFTPARAGDALKVVLLNRARGAPLSLSKATGAVLADKVVDIASLVLLCAVSGVAGTIWASARARVSPLVIALAICTLLVVVLLSLRWGGRLSLAALTDPRRLLTSFGFSLGAWLAELFALQILCAAVGFAQPLQHLVLAVALLNAGVSVPLSPANVGIYEVVLAFGLAQSGMATPAALAVATLHHGLELLAMNVAAAVLYVHHLSRCGSSLASR